MYGPLLVLPGYLVNRIGELVNSSVGYQLRLQSQPMT